MPDRDAQHRPEDLGDVRALLLNIRNKHPVYCLRNRLTGQVLRVFPAIRTGNPRHLFTADDSGQVLIRSEESLAGEDWHVVRCIYPTGRRSGTHTIIVDGDNPRYRMARSARRI
jgi:hypothetical protein